MWRGLEEVLHISIVGKCITGDDVASERHSAEVSIPKAIWERYQKSGLVSRQSKVWLLDMAATMGALKNTAIPKIAGV